MRRSIVGFVGIAASIDFIAAIYHACERFHYPFAAWITDVHQWYDEVIGALFYAALAGACFKRLYRQHKSGSGDIIANPRGPWREKTELRFILYCFSAMLFLIVPSDIFKAIQATKYVTWGASTIWSNLPGEVFFYPIIGVGLILYDRRQLRSRPVESNQIFCHKCGYDLRATPERCPECGTVVLKKSPA